MSLILLPLALLASTTAAVQGAEPAEAPIVVTGVRIQDYRDALRRCLERSCPTNEDADATLALAEALFLTGEYRDGRDVLQASLRRNSRNARNFPEPVSDLYRAHSRLSRHLGFDEDGRRSVYGTLRALREGIPEEDHRHFTARMEIIDLLMRSAQFMSARRELRQLVLVARRANRDDVATLAELRMLLIDEIIYPRGQARQRLIQMSRMNGPNDRMRSTGAKILLARIYRDEGNHQRADALIAEVGQGARAGTARRLLHAPRYELQVRGLQTLFPGGIPDNFEDKWIDVGFWVTPDGRVAGLEILRHDNNTDWADPLIRSIRGRRYSESAEPTYRLERYSYTSGYTRTTRTRLPVRSEAARVEYLDLTTGEAPPVVPPSARDTPN